MGCAFAADSTLFALTSQRATMVSPPTSFRLAPPRPPEPRLAVLSLALGDFSWPWPVCRPAIQNPAPARDAFRRKSRRLMRDMSMVSPAKWNPEPPAPTRYLSVRPQRRGDELFPERKPAGGTVAAPPPGKRKAGAEESPRRPFGQVGCSLQRPALAVLALDPLVGFGAVLGLEVGRVPLELLAEPHRQVAQQDELREGSRLGEVRERRLAALDGVDPLGVVARGAGQRGLGLLHVLELLLRQPFARAAVVVGGIERALRPDEERSAAGDLLALVELDGRLDEDVVLLALVPDHLAGRHVAARGELVGDLRPAGVGFRIDRLRLGFHRRRGAEPKRAVGQIRGMAGHIAEGAGAEVPPAAPLEVQVGGVVGALGRRAEPLVPVQVRGHRGGVLGPRGDIRRLRPDGAVGPEVDLLDVADQAGLDDLDRLAQVPAGASLVAHLGGDLVLGRDLGHLPGFVDVVGQGLLRIDAFAQLHGHDAGAGVVIVGDADGDAVDLLGHLVEHLAVVEVLLGLRELRPCLVVSLVVDVAEADDVAELGDVAHVAPTLASRADAGDADLGVGRLLLAVADLATGDPESGGAHAGILEELAAIAALGHECLPYKIRRLIQPGPPGVTKSDGKRGGLRGPDGPRGPRDDSAT